MPIGKTQEEDRYITIAEAFLEYAGAFEKTYEDDDWSRLEAFFTPDAVYLPGDGKEISGRANLLAHLRQSVDALDRRFDSRAPGLISGPTINGNQVSIQWTASYTKSGVPELVLSGFEEATYQGNAISRLEDRLDDGVAEALQDWIERHGESAGVTLG